MADTDDLIISVSTDTTAIKRALTKLGADIDAASSNISRKFDKVGASLDNSVTTALQARVNAMVGIGVQGANEWSGALADQGKQLDILRAKYNPLFATVKQYQAAAGNIRTLYASGTIGIDEYTAAMSRQRQATLSTIAAIKSQGVASVEAAVAGEALHGAASVGATQMLALGHAARSSIEQLAMGVPVTQVLTSEFGHLSYAASGPGGITGLLKSIGSGAVSLAERFPQVGVAIGAVAAVGALYYAATHASSERSEEDLGKQIDLIRGVTESWGAATPALSRYIDELDRAKEVADALAAGRAAGDLGFDEVRKSATDVAVQKTDVVSQVGEAGDTDAVDKINNAWKRVSEAIEKGRTDTLAIKDMQDVLAQALTDTAIPSITDFAKAFATLADAMEKANTQAQIFNAEAIAAIAGGSTVQDITAPATFTDQNGKTHQTSTFLPDQVPTPERRPNIELEGLPGDDAAAKKAATAAEELKKKQDELFRTAGDRIAQMQQEIDLTGKYGVAVDAAKFSLDEWQKAEKLNLDPTQKAALQDKIDQYGKMADALAKVKLSSDLADGNRIAGLSSRQQQIVAMQKQYGLPTDPDSATGKQIGQSLDQKDLSSSIATFFTDLEGGLTKKGAKIGEVLGDAIKNAFTSWSEKALKSLFDQLGNGIASLLTGGGGTAGAGGIVSKLVSPAALTAPLIPVTRSPLPDIPTTDVASYIAKAASARGIDPVTALAVAKSEGGLSSWNQQSGVFKNGVQEPSFGPFQLYKGGGLGNAFQDKTGLDPADASSGPAGIDFALDHAKQNGWASWYGAKNTGISNWQGIGTGSETDASKALDKLAASSTDATKGLGKLGTNLASAFPPMPAGGVAGGGANWLSLLSGSIFSGSGQLAKSGGIGLFADGGHISGPGGPRGDKIPLWGSDGEFMVNADATKKHRGLLEAINSGHAPHFADGGLVSPSLMAPVAPALVGRTAQGSSKGEPGVLQVHINGANGDEHVRMLVKQGVNSGLSQYNDNMRRGGFGTMQQRWTSQKG